MDKKGEKLPTATLSTEEVVSHVSRISGVSKEKTRAVLTSYYGLLYDAIMIGYKIFIPNIGHFEPRLKHGRMASDYFDFKSNQVRHFDKVEDYYRPSFVMSKILTNEARERKISPKYLNNNE
jgi:nucleoid DNA-binding protein